MAFGAGFMLAVALVGSGPGGVGSRWPGAASMLLGTASTSPSTHSCPIFTSVKRPTASRRGRAHAALDRSPAPHLLRWGCDRERLCRLERELGLLLFLAVFLHKLPEGVAMASVALASGQGRRRALLAAGALGIATIVGVVLTDTLAPLQAHGRPLRGRDHLRRRLQPGARFQGGGSWRMPLALLGGSVAFS